MDLFFWSLVDEVHELVEFWSDDDLCATVALLTHCCVVVSDWVVLTTTTCCEALWIYTILCLEFLYYT